MKTFTAFLFGLILGAVAMWLGLSPRFRDNVKDTAVQAREKVAEKTPEVKERVEKAADAVAEATSDARITAAIKLKLAGDPDLSAVQIHVSTTDALVTLSGRVKSPDFMDKAINLAKSVDGVREVKSTLQVTP
jgi:osmotically-inducible protein OsmY